MTSKSDSQSPPTAIFERVGFIILALASAVFEGLAAYKDYAKSVQIFLLLLFAVSLFAWIWRFPLRWRRERDDLQRCLAGRNFDQELASARAKADAFEPELAKLNLELDKYRRLAEPFHDLAHVARDGIAILLDTVSNHQRAIRDSSNSGDPRILRKVLSNEAERHLGDVVDQVRAFFSNAVSPNVPIWTALRILDKSGYVTRIRRGDCYRKARIESSVPIAENDKLVMEMIRKHKETGDGILTINSDGDGRPDCWPEQIKLGHDRWGDDRSIVMGPCFILSPPAGSLIPEPKEYNRELAAILFVSSPHQNAFTPMHSRLMKGCCDVLSLVFNVQLRILKQILEPSETPSTIKE